MCDEKDVERASSPASDTKSGTADHSLRSGMSEVEFEQDALMERTVWQKMDWRILPVVAMFYLLSFLDRTNLGNARVAGLQKELNMTNTQYSIALTVTYIPYILAELPSNLLLRVVGARLMLPTMLSLWGVVTICQGAVNSYQGLLACRFFLGLFEGGVFPGLVLYLSGFYPRKRLQTRISAFFSTASASGAFSGILAYGIIRLDGKGGYPGWAYIFFLEGGFTVAFGLAAFFLMPNTPETTRFLSKAEGEYITRQLRKDGALCEDELCDDFAWKEVRKAFMLPHVWLLSLAFFFSGTILYGLAYFTPSIVASLGYTASRAQLFSVPPFAVAFVFTMALALLSDKYEARGIASIICAVFCVIGFGMFLGTKNQSIQYGSLFFSIPGVYCSAPTLSTWGANNVAPYTRRATAIAIGFIMTNSGGILATWLLGSISPVAPYRVATIVLLVFSVGMGISCLLNVMYLSAMNRAKAHRRQQAGERVGRDGLGDQSPWFEYTL